MLVLAPDQSGQSQAINAGHHQNAAVGMEFGP
jgi:hypothetical protein